MGNVFRNLKTEWVPSVGYMSLQQAQRDISYYLMHHYNWIRPQQFNGGLPPAIAEKNLNSVAHPNVPDTKITLENLNKRFESLCVNL